MNRLQPLEVEKQDSLGLLSQLSLESEALLLSLANMYQYRLEDFPQAIACLKLFLASRDNSAVRARIA